MHSQPLLFSEPAFSETAVWCELSEGIDPARWARICRVIGKMPTEKFEQFYAHFMTEQADPEFGRQSKAMCASRSELNRIPIVSIGPGKPGDSGQWEI